MDWNLAQVNIARLHAPMDDPLIDEFRNALEPINVLAEASRGFVWRLQTEIGNATDLQPTDDELVIINMSVWASVEALADYVYRSDHTAFLRRRREWFQRYGKASVALWWIPAATTPTVEEGLRRLELIEANGPTPEAFSFAKRFAPPGADTPVVADERDVCPA